MKKILKRLLISTALITPIAISTPLLLTSCSTDVAETGPSIFNQSYGPIELFTGDNNSPKGYYLDAELNEATNLNEIFKKVLDIVPESPKFVDIATPTSKLFDLGDFKLSDTITPALPEGLTNKVNYTEFKLTDQELSTPGKSNAISKIFENFVFESTSTDDRVIAYYPSTAFNLEKFKNDIRYDVVYTVKQFNIHDSKGNIIKRVILSDISFTFKLKDTSKPWAGLKTSDPIYVSINWSEDSKATLFKGGFKLTPEITGDSSQEKSINFTGTLNQSVFGTDASKIDKTDKIKQWFEGKTGNELNGTGSGTLTGPGGSLSDANKNVVNRIKQIFDNVNKEIINPGVESSSKSNKNPVKIETANLTDKFIKGANKTKSTTKASIATLGSGNVEASIHKITKKDSENRAFTIELEFKLTNDNDPGWYGLTGEAARLPIKFILDVTTTAA